MAEERVCERCGTGFVPRREHARFCSVPCRVEWNRDHVGDPAAGASALQWSITAMSETAERLPWVGVWDRERAFAALGEAVWWITMVDATLVRHHLATYDRVMASQAVTERRLIEGTLAGLRFVRNWMGQHLDPADFIQPKADSRGHGMSRITAWTWRSVPEPVLSRLPPRGQAWELTRYWAYQAQLARHTIGQPFELAATFLKTAAASASLGAGVPAAG